MSDLGSDEEMESQLNSITQRNIPSVASLRCYDCARIILQPRDIRQLTHTQALLSKVVKISNRCVRQTYQMNEN